MGSLSTKTGLYVDESRKMGSLSTNTGKNLPIGVVLGLTRYENQAKVRLVGMI